MLDVEFLLDPPPALGRPLVYRYRSGILRGPLKNALRAIVERDRIVLVPCRPRELPFYCAGGGLFSNVALCDWPTEQNAVSDLDAMLDLHDSQPVAVLIQAGHALFKRAWWPDVEQACLVIDEPTVELATTAPILKYLVHRSKLVPDNALLGQSAFRRHFDDLVSDHESMNLPSFMQEFDRTVLLHVDPKTGIFFRHDALRKQRASATRIMRPLRRLVEREDPLQLSDLLRGLAARFPSGRNGRELADELGRHTQSLLKPKASDHRRERSHADRRAPRGFSRYPDQRTNVLVWTAVLLAFTPRLFQIGLQEAGRREVADLSLVAVDQMGREFLRRVSQDDGTDPLSGLWSELQQVMMRARLEDDEASTVQGKLVRLLARHLEQWLSSEPPWAARLRLILTDEITIVMSGQHSETPDSSKQREPPLSRKPGSFADVIGHQLAVKGLCERLHGPEDSTPLILYGPEGVGKKTLGRIYAKGLLCEGMPNGSAPPCGCCGPCRQFETGSLFDFIEFDASAPYAPNYVQERLLKNLGYASFARHRPVIIANPEKAPRVVDMFLKTLEAHSESTRFIFTVTDLKAMSATGQSRCEVYRLAPLVQEDAEQLGKRFLGYSGLSYDERTIDLIVGQAGGLPRRLLNLCNSVSSSNSTTLEEVRRALNLSWADEAISYCQRLLVREEPEDELLTLPRGWHPREAICRIRSIFAEMYCVYETGKTQHSALMHLEGDPIHELASLLDDRATEMGLSFQDLWAALSRGPSTILSVRWAF